VVWAEAASLKRHVSAALSTRKNTRMIVGTSPFESADYGLHRQATQGYVGGTNWFARAGAFGIARSAFADQFADAALKLTLLLFALTQSSSEIGAGKVVFRTECDADKIVAPPDDPGEEAAAFSRDGQT
jgi:hypothetical protein